MGAHKPNIVIIIQIGAAYSKYTANTPTCSAYTKQNKQNNCWTLSFGTRPHGSMLLYSVGFARSFDILTCYAFLLPASFILYIKLNSFQFRVE